MFKKLRTYLGRVIRDIGRKIEANGVLEVAFAKLLALARRVHGRSSSISAGRRSILCMRPKSNASAKARLIGRTSSASRPPSQPTLDLRRAASSCCT